MIHVKIHAYMHTEIHAKNHTHTNICKHIQYVPPAQTPQPSAATCQGVRRRGPGGQESSSRLAAGTAGQPKQTAAVGKTPIALKSVQNRQKGFFVSPEGVFFVPLWDKKNPIRARKQPTAGSAQQLNDFHKEMQCAEEEGVFSVPEGVFFVPIMGFYLSLYGVLFGPEGVFFVLYPI